MALYFFRVHANGRAISDDEGYELATVQEACREVLATLARIAKGELRDHTDISITASDIAGCEVFTASVSLRFGPIGLGSTHHSGQHVSRDATGLMHGRWSDGPRKEDHQSA